MRGWSRSSPRFANSYPDCSTAARQAGSWPPPGDADVIVVGSRGAGGFARLLTAPVSTRVSQHARCPVVIVPRGRPRIAPGLSIGGVRGRRVI